MRLGFVLDQTTCIACHACTVACKSENQVPLGAFRTWVKYIEKGEFPDVRRHFAVLRGNHCDDAPCVAICPTRALFRRPDGIVDFDRDTCIGCKSCMQACPYDALYIDPETHTAAKCHVCAHRIDKGLEPACVVVCPVQAIHVVDLDDPQQELARKARNGELQARKVEQGTRPKTFYVGADPATIDPDIDKARGPYPFAHQDALPASPEAAPVREIYDVAHETAWGWKVWSYLWTKSIAAGVLCVAAAVGLLAPSTASLPLFSIAAPAVALVFIAVTAALLVFDLRRPERFWYLMVRPNWTSWLVWGGYTLGAFGATAAVWLLAGLTGASGVLRILFWPAVPLSLLTAGYTAFLFHQAKGRDFWESKLLLPHLLIQAIVAGAAVLSILAPAFEEGSRLAPIFWVLLDVGLICHAALLAADLYGPHANAHVTKAASAITAGAHRGDFLVHVLAVGIAAPLILVVVAPLAGEIASSLGLLASLAALWGMFRYERMWIQAGQSVPLS
ncbi:MAG: polysulfide reductase NrfD [Planctomycetes bacterium]|nr:polysulfide reductase NrfD [Planctomycetota bacterium]